MSFFEMKDFPVGKKAHSLWVEHYRPNKLSDYIGNDYLKRKIEQYINTGDVPHLLLYGNAGTGKTTLAKIIASSIDCDVMIINASDENNVDTIRNKVKSFASTVSFKQLKIIILDEFDYMTQNAQAILRNLMETYSNHCRFILTCNYIEKVISPIQSRCQTFKIEPPSKKDVAVHIAHILQDEMVEFEIADIGKLINNSYPDIRKIINTCQLNSFEGRLDLDDSSIVGNQYELKVLDILKSDKSKETKMVEVRQVVIDSKVSDFTDLFTLLHRHIDEYAGGSYFDVVMAISEGQYKHFHAIDKEIPVTATLFEIIKSI